MKLISENDEVYYVDKNPMLLKKIDVNNLTALADKSKRKRARYCTHENINHPLHEMFEVFTKETYLRPLKQNKIYSFHVIFGKLNVYLFSDNGEVTDMFQLGDYNSELPFYFRAPENRYRTFVPTTDFVLYHETTTGPFIKEDTIFAPWAPVENDADEIKKFLLKLKNKGR